MQILAERLKELREEKQISLSKLSKKLGISDAAICKWENELTEPKASNIKSLCDYFEVSSDYLLGLEDECGAKAFSIPKTKSADGLSFDAKQLLEIFQALEPMHQKQILGYAQGFYQRSHPNKQKNFF